MSDFETFDKSSIPLSRRPRVTIQKRGTITINAAAHAALGEPEAVELLFDREAQVLGLRAVGLETGHAAFVRPSARNRRGPWVISAMAFMKFFGIDTTVARRWNATVDQDTLSVDMSEPGAVVSKDVAVNAPEPEPERPRPRPRPRRASGGSAD